MKKEHPMAGAAVFLWATLPLMTTLFLADFPSMTPLFYSSALAASRRQGHGPAIAKRERQARAEKILLCFAG